ncbi:porin [Rhodoferax sp. AJA081-3]|uniref:porin n=1 Tax=Rhodoferax sp. AJA081-3 TaxID=2752316 RepID=UPI001ADF2359|nr:porin [Rhodoferax sp. AJA081-3]QTN30048.1 porin [Rhodoferax sp. AJA081-3]
MKKTLIALAVLAASTASMAQVTLYGVADLSLSATDMAGARSDASMSGNGTLNDGNSRWGIRAVEDLGGGMKLTAQFEQNINYETGATGTSDGRYAYMALDGGFGRLKAGRTLSPSFFGVATWELTGAANFTAVGNQFAFAGAGSRNSSEFSYTTPKMGGLSATVGYVTELDLAVAPNQNVSKVDANVIYAAGPLAAALSYNKLSNASDGNYALGANYNFGSFIVAASFQDAVGQSQGWSLGASLPMGPWKFTVDVAQDTGYDDTNWLAYAGYSLSKRTTVYGAYYDDGKSGTAVKKTAVQSKTYGIGVRHNF